MRRTAVVTKLLLIVAFLVAAGARVYYFQVRHPDTKSAPTTRPAGTLTPDEALRRDMWSKEGYNGTVARNLVASHRFAAYAPLSGHEPWEGTKDEAAPGTAFVAPAYPALLAVVYKLAGPANFMALFVVQAILGALCSIFAFYLARRVFQSTFAGWLAWLATAGSPFLISAVVKVDPPVLASTMITWSVLTIVAAADSQSFWRHLLAGLITALAVLVTPGYLIVVPFAYVWTLTYGQASPGKRFALSLVCVAMFVVALAPWAVRNYKVFHRCVPLVTGGGYHYWLGNNPKASGGDQVWTDKGKAFVADLALTPDDRTRYTSIGNEADRFKEMAEDGWTWAKNDPFKNIQLRLHTYVYFWFGQNAWLSERPIDLENPLVLSATILVLLLALIGIGARKTERQRAKAWMLYVVLILYPIPYALTHVTSSPLYRLALDPLLLILGAYAVATFLTCGRVGRGPKAPEFASNDFELETQPQT